MDENVAGSYGGQKARGGSLGGCICIQSAMIKGMPGEKDRHFLELNMYSNRLPCRV